MSAIQILHGDSLEILPTLEPESVDAVITDPPYNISKAGVKLDRRHWAKETAKRCAPVRMDFGDWDKMTPEAFRGFTGAWLEDCSRVMKDGAPLLAFFAGDFLETLRACGEQAGLNWICWGVWHKLNPIPQVAARSKPCNSLEAWALFSKGRIKTWNGGPCWHNFIESPTCQGSERTIHPTQKALAAVEPLIEALTVPGDLILDPFMGSGTIPVAARKLGRHIIGIEREEEYYRLCEVRLGLRPPTARDLKALRVAPEVSPADPALPLLAGIEAAHG